MLIQTDLKLTVLANKVFHVEKILKCHLKVIDESKYLALVAALGEAFKSEKKLIKIIEKYDYIIKLCNRASSTEAGSEMRS